MEVPPPEKKRGRSSLTSSSARADANGGTQSRNDLDGDETHALNPLDGSDAEEEGTKDLTKYGFYKGDPFANPVCYVKTATSGDVRKEQHELYNRCVSVAANYHSTLSIGLQARLKGSPLYMEAKNAGRIDIQRIVVHRTVSECTTISLEPRPFDLPILGAFKNLVNMKPSTTFVETKEAFHESVRRLRVKGWDSEKTDANDCMLGAMLYELGIAKDTRVKALAQLDIDKDIVKFPTCTLAWAENKIFEYEGIVSRQTGGGAVQNHQVKAATSRGGGRSGGGRGGNTGRGENSRSNQAAAKNQKGGSSYCGWCKKEGHWTAHCTDGACPQSVKDDALRLFKEEIAAKKAINDLKRSGKN